MPKNQLFRAFPQFIYAATISLLATFGASAQTVQYVHTDGLGTVVLTTDKDRNIVERSEYEPYGNLLNRPLANGIGFTGHVQDAVTELTYMQQRYYDADFGRFLSADPVTAYEDPAEAFNRYWYANNNPYSFFDPDGRFASDDKKDKAPAEPTRLPEITVVAPSTQPRAVQNLAGITVTALRVWPTVERISWPIWISATIGARVSGVALFLYAPYPCDSERCGEMPADQILVFSKGGKQNVRDSGLIGVSDEEISRRLRDPNTPAAEKKRLQREEKGRRLRNKTKREK